MLRALGSPTASAWAALELMPGGGTQLVVVERATRGGAVADPEIAGWVRDAKHLARLEHPNVARVRDVVIRSDEILVVGDFMDAVAWSRLAQRTPPPPLEVTLRVLVDVLSGLSAMHNLRDQKRVPLKLVHGYLTPARVLVGCDGIARLLRAPPKGAEPDRSTNAYLAPEVLLEDESADSRADTYSVGVMLWEALSGEPLFAGLGASAIVTHLLSGRVPPPTPRAGSAATAPLVDLVRRAMSPDPEKRFESAAAMAAELRRVAGSGLATAAQIGALVSTSEGRNIGERRERLERGEVAPVGPGASAGMTLDLAILLDKEEDDDDGLSVAPTPVRPAPSRTAAAPRLPAVPLATPEPTALTTLTGSSRTARPVDAPPRQRRSRALVVLALLASMLVATSALGWWLRSRGTPTSPHARAERETPPSQPGDPIEMPGAQAIAAPSEAAPATAPSDAPATPGVIAPRNSALPAPAPPRPHPVPRRHYQPEGI